jgi:hypothetical protein
MLQFPEDAPKKCPRQATAAARPSLGRVAPGPARWHEDCWNIAWEGYRESVKVNEDESDLDRVEPATGKGAARRRVDAYHEALRERLALRELEQPFVQDERRL